MKKLKLFEGLVKQKINEQIDYNDQNIWTRWEGYSYDFGFKYAYLRDKPTKELLELVNRGELSPYATEEEKCAYCEIEQRLFKAFGEEYEIRFGSDYKGLGLSYILTKLYNTDDRSYGLKDILEWLNEEVEFYISFVNESKMIINESRNPRKGDIIVIDSDLEVKVLHCFTSAKSAAAYERKVNITKDDGYSISEKINSGIIDANESGLYVYALYEDKIKLFDFTDEDVDWEIKDKK